MPYTVWVRSVDGKIGTLSAEVATPSAAKRSAEHLRKQRLVVTITDPDGETVEESRKLGWKNCPKRRRLMLQSQV